MNLKKFCAGAMMALLGLPAMAQAEDPVVIKGNLIDWYYYGKDIHSSDIGWHQQSTGGGAWIDSLGVSHATGASNYGLMALTINSNNPGKPLLPSFLIRNHILYSNCGGVYVGGNVYYSFFGHEKNATENIDNELGSEEYEILVRKWTWDLDEQGNYVNVKYETVGTFYNQPTDLTYDPLNDIVYGVFSIGDDGYKLGTLNMETFQITYISREAMPLTGELRTLAVNSKGQLFGTDKSGNVFEVSTVDGTLRTIGNMGFPNQQKMQSATFDFRTDKLYWLGFMNNGKSSNDPAGTNTTATVAEGGRDTGLYEINTETGEATLIGKTDFKDVILEYDDYGNITDSKENIYGKMQMTGIYVEGAFTKAAKDLRTYFAETPVQMKNGEPGSNNVTVTVKNIGLEKVLAKNYVVKFYADGQLVGTIDRDGDGTNEENCTDNLEAGKAIQLTFTYNASTTPGNHVLKVEVEYADDEQLRNNSAEASVRVLTDKMLPQVKLEGVQNGNGLDLSWQNPNGRIVEGAEDFVPFTYSGLGEWTMYDGDKAYPQTPQNFNSSIAFANSGKPKAFIVFDPIKAGFDLAVGGEKFAPYAGKQYFASFWSAVPDNSDAGGHQVANDDWIISPELSGEAQTISFMAKGYIGTEAVGQVTTMDHIENMRVLYSTTDTAIASFQVVKDTFTVNNRAWTKYEAELPAGAKYFALQYCSEEGFVVMIDDIEFFVKPREVKGYNLYKNGVFVEQLAADQTAYSVKRTSTSDQYTMTVVYDDGESNPSNAMSIDYLNYLLGIEPVAAAPAAEGVQIFNMRGQRVTSMQRPGLYIVKNGSKTRKVMVK